MKTKDLLQLALIAGLVYAVYVLYNQAKQITAPVANSIADFYTWLTLPPSMMVNGNIVMPDGSLVPLAATDVRQNGANVVVAAYQGHFYQLSPSDANGNWPATLIQ